jgi:hypothetical protein
MTIPFYESRRWKFRQWFRRTKIAHLKYYIHNRWIGKPHQVTVKWLKPGQYSDRVEILFHAVFQILVDFVEEELAAQTAWSESSEREKWRAGEDIEPIWKEYFEASWWSRRKNRKQWAERFGVWQLDWYATLDGPEEEYPNLHQAKFGREAKRLYLWYKHERDARPDSFEVFDAVPKDQRYILDDGTPTDEMFEPEVGGMHRMRKLSPEYSEMLQKSHDLEEEQHEEDQRMLKEVIDLRRGLWT